MLRSAVIPWFVAGCHGSSQANADVVDLLADGAPAPCTIALGTSLDEVCFYGFQCNDDTIRGVHCNSDSCQCLVDSSHSTGPQYPEPEGCETSYADLGALALENCPVIVLDGGADP